MTSPAPFPKPDKITRANWLGRYLDVERGLDDKLRLTMTSALDHIDEAFDGMGEGFSKRVRRQQLAASKRSMRDLVSHIFGVTGEHIRATKHEAAVAAVDAELYDDRGILARIFPDSVSRQQYADSLRQTARRGAENVVSRVLFAEKPLSEQVYKTEALANGLVSQKINQALARGDSAKNLAKSVRDLIDPNVKGGISYAAERLGRTELNNTFHATAIKTAQDTPWVQQMEWHLSKVHEKDDCACEKYALQKFFDIGQVPEKPHPNCRCFVTSVQDYDSFENALLGGQYDSYLDDVFGVDDLIEAREESPFPEGTSDRVRAAYEKARKQGKHEVYPNKSWSPAEKKAAQKLTSRLGAEAIAQEQSSQLVTEAEKAVKRKMRITDETIPENVESATNSLQVANFLQTKYEGLEVTGFDYADVDVRAAQQIATGFEERIKKHPRTNIRALRIVDDLADHEAAMTRYNTDKKGMSDIVFNHTRVANFDVAVREQKASKKSGHYSAIREDDEKSFYYTTIHEWGHVLDFSGGRNRLSRTLKPKGNQLVGEGLMRRWYKNFREPGFIEDVEDFNADVLPKFSKQDLKEYQAWVKDNLPSGYSFAGKARTKPHDLEMVAESYLEFMKNPGATAEDTVPGSIVRELARRIKRNDELNVAVRLRD